MPLEQRVITPIYVSRGCFTLNAGHSNGQIPQSALNIPNELECVTNGTLANVIRSLSSVSRHAEDLFGSILEETSALVHRSVSLKARLDVLSERVERLDASNDSGPLSAGATGTTLSKKPFRSRADNFDQQVVSRTTIPISLREVWERCEKPPPLDKLNPFRDDNSNGLLLYTNPNFFFELWRKEMLDSARHYRNKNLKKGENAHRPTKTKVGKGGMLRHQTSINSDSTASPAHIGQQQQQQATAAAASAAGHYHVQNASGHLGPYQRGSISSNDYQQGQMYQENGILVHPAAAVAQAQAQHAAYTQQQQQKIYGQTGPNGSIYGYTGVPGGDVVTMKREEPNPSGVGTYTVIEGYSVDPNNYQHHYVQYPGQGQPGTNRPNSLELSQHQQQQQYAAYGQAGQPPPPPMEQQYGHYQQQTYQRPQQQGPYGPHSIYGQTGQHNQAPSQQQYSPGSAANTPTRRAASRPSAPPPAPPSNPNSAPSTPKKLNGNGDMMSGHSPLVSRDSLPPPPPPPQGANGAPGMMMMGMHHQDSLSESVLPPPPPPPPPMPGGPGGSGMTQNGANVCSPPPPPPPPMNLNGPGPMTTSTSAQHKPPSSSTTQNGGNNLPTAEMLLSVKLKPTQTNSNKNGKNSYKEDPRSNLMAAIRDGIKLKRVEESRAREVEKSAPLHDVASILARRVAMELSDSEGDNENDEEDSDAWDDESEC